MEEQEKIVAARLAANPAAREIDDDEAEAFMAVAVSVRTAAPDLLRLLTRATGVPYTGNTHRGRKFTALMILRRWPQKQCWRFLIESLRYIRMYRVGSVAEDGDRITPEMLAMRMLGRAGEIPTFLAGVSEWGERKCRTWLDLSRLKLREIVCGDPSRPEEAGTSGQEQANLKRTLRSKTALMESLALDRQRLERSRRARVQALQHQVAEARREFAAAIREREAWLAELARVTRRPPPPA